MKGLPVELTAELEKEYAFIRHLFKLSLESGPYYYTNADIDVYYDGHWWEAKGIRFDAAKYSASPRVDSLTFEIENIDRRFSALLLSEETRGKECTIYQVALDKNMAILGATIFFLGYFDAAEVDNRVARFDIFNHFIRWKMLTPRRFHSATCPWTFKGTYCAYAGYETWCDHSWERCVALGNKLNFGGFRWCPWLVEKQIWWGRSPSN